jgi:thymidine phosphorylase
MIDHLSTLHVRRVGIDTWRENVAFLHRNCPVVRAAGFQALAKVTVRTDGRSITAVLNVVDDECIVGPLELGLSEEAFARLDVDPGEEVAVEHAEPPPSIAHCTARSPASVSRAMTCWR